MGVSVISGFSGLYICSHLLQEKVSLMSEQVRGLVYEYSRITSYFITTFVILKTSGIWFSVGLCTI